MSRGDGRWPVPGWLHASVGAWDALGRRLSNARIPGPVAAIRRMAGMPWWWTMGYPCAALLMPLSIGFLLVPIGTIGSIPIVSAACRRGGWRPARWSLVRCIPGGWIFAGIAMHGGLASPGRAICLGFVDAIMWLIAIICVFGGAIGDGGPEMLAAALIARSIGHMAVGCIIADAVGRRTSTASKASS